tara:strand:+ start:525 stop:1367 length:843 start_codon:yes stop_codon:yes gene_type:complete
VSKWLQNLIIITSLLLVSCSTPSLSEQVLGKDLNLNIIETVANTVEVENVFGEVLEILDAPNLTIPEQRSRSAAVKVRSLLQGGHGSGTYMIAHNRRVVVTAAHVVRNESVMAIDGRDGETVVGQVVFTDEKNDIAFIVVPEMNTRTAIRYRPRKIYNERLIGTPITYTGFPSHHDLLTVRGYISALEYNMVVTNMFGWFGSSGSGVYDRSGRLVGVVSGIDMGRFGPGFPIPLDSIVWVAPISKIDHEILEIRIRSAQKMENIKAFPGARGPRRGGRND